MPDAAEWFTDNARVVVVLMLVASAVAVGGIPMVERSTSLDQFQTDADEARALEYSDEHFGAGTANETTVQVVVQDGDVLDRETLLSILEYEQALRDNQTVDETLVENDSMRSVANLIATAAIRENEAVDLRTRERELSETGTALDAALDSLANDSNASVEATFEEVDANTSVNLTEADYRLFADAVAERRATAEETATDDGTRTEDGARTEDDQSGTRTGSADVTRRILADEYAALAEDEREMEALDPSLDRQVDALRASNDSQVESLAADVLAGNTSRSARALAFVPDHYEPGATSTNATLVVVTQERTGGSFAPGDAPAAIEASQSAMAALAPVDGVTSVLLYGDGIVSTEITDSMVESVLLVGPLAIGLVLLVLVVVYRDVSDVALGLLGIVLVLAWTFGAMGWFGIAFSQPYIVVLVLLIGLSIDYGLHVVMRYREARQSTDTSPGRAMRVALGSVGVALVYVTTTTALGFLSNLSSPLAVFRDLGVVSAIGIVATLLVFGLLVPAVKLELDEFLEGRDIDRAKPAVGTGSGPVNRVLDFGATLATTAPYVVIAVALLVSAGGAYGATEIDASFEQSDFLAEDPDDWLKDLPDAIAPRTYTAGTAIDALDRNFVRQDTTATILVRGDVTDPETLDRLAVARSNATEMEATETYADGEAAITDPVTVMERVAADDESFRETLAAADTDDDGIPDENVTGVYDELYRVAPEQAGDVVHRADGEYRAVRMVVTVDGGVADDVVRDQMDWVAADADSDGVSTIATGDVIVNQITADQLAETALLSLVVALLSVLAVLTLAYHVTEGSASLGVVTIVPVAFTLTWVLGTMALLEIPFNIVTGMITGLTIGLGVDYSLHVSERFNQELANAETVAAALHETMTGTGGALLSSAVTTASGFAVLLVAILPFLQSFGLITALTITFAFLASVFVLPSLLVVWVRLTGRDPAETGGLDVDSTTIASEARRTVRRSLALPGESVQVTVALRDVRGRVALQESPPGDIVELEAAPEPVVVDRRDGRVIVLWDAGESPSELTLEYAVELPGDPSDGDTFAFAGFVEDGDVQRPVRGDDTVTVIGNVVNRVVERGSVTDADLQAAVDHEDVEAAEAERVRRAWLDDT